MKKFPILQTVNYLVSYMNWNPEDFKTPDRTPTVVLLFSKMLADLILDIYKKGPISPYNYGIIKALGEEVVYGKNSSNAYPVKLSKTELEGLPQFNICREMNMEPAVGVAMSYWEIKEFLPTLQKRLYGKLPWQINTEQVRKAESAALRASQEVRRAEGSNTLRRLAI